MRKSLATNRGIFASLGRTVRQRITHPTVLALAREKPVGAHPALQEARKTEPCQFERDLKV
jgi:hypothetical protein